MNIDLSSTFKDARQLTNTWKERYSNTEYAERIIMNIFYRKYTIQKMWPTIFDNEFSNWETAYKQLKYKYSEVALSINPILESKLRADEKVCSIRFSDFSSSIQAASFGNKDALKSIEYTYFLHRIFDDLILVWAAFVVSGESKINAISKLTGAIFPREMPINTYEEIEYIFDQAGAEAYLNKLFKNEEIIQNKILTNNEIIDFYSEANKCRDLSSLIEFNKKVQHINDPVVYHKLGVKYLIFGDRIRSKDLLTKGAYFGLKYPGVYFDGTVIDSIGQCLALIATQFNIQDIASFYNVTCLAYIYLSRAIELGNNKTYDSFRTRAILFEQSKNINIVSTILKNHLEINVSHLPFAISDFYSASKIDINTLRNSDLESAIYVYNCFNRINRARNINNEESLDEVSNFGSSGHESLYQKMYINFLNGDFYMDELEVV